MVSTRAVKPRFSVGEKVLCYEPDPLKAKVLYNSKVLKILEDRDVGGRRGLEFLIHFSGWNATWDRYVTEDFILKDTEENRKLQQELAQKAQLTSGGNLYKKERHSKNRRHRKSSSHSTTSQSTTDANDSSYDIPNGHSGEEDTGCGTTTNSSADDTSSCSDERDDSNNENINTEFPPTVRCITPVLSMGHLSHFLANDRNQILNNNMVVSLPALPNVIEILDAFYRHEAEKEINTFPNNTPSQYENMPPTLHDLMKSLNSLEQFIDGVRIHFEFSLKDTLLFRSEKNQFEFYQKNHQRSSTPIMKNEINESSDGVLRESDEDETSTNERRESCSSNDSRKIKRELSSDEFDGGDESETDKNESETDKKPALDSFDSDSEHRSEQTDNCEQSDTNSVRSIKKETTYNENVHSWKNPSCNGTEPAHERLDSVSSVESTISSTNGGQSSSISSSGDYLVTLNSSRARMLQKLNEWEFVPEHVMNSSPPLPSVLYGAVHLTRLFVVLPHILHISQLTDENLEYLMDKLKDLIDYMKRHEDWYRSNIYVNNTF